MAPRRAGPVSTESVDDYLKAIFELSGTDDVPVTSNALAGRLAIRAAPMTGMLQRLAAERPSFVHYEKHRGVRLSPSGKKRALEVVRHHRLIERFLHDVLGYSWEEVHEEAERLEHYISEKLKDRIAAKLGHPETDPHGHPIPEKDGAVRNRAETQLSKWACGVPGIVSSVSDRNATHLREMRRLGITPGVRIVLGSGLRKTSLHAQIGPAGNAVRIGQRLAGDIWVLPEAVAASPDFLT